MSVATTNDLTPLLDRALQEESFRDWAWTLSGPGWRAMAPFPARPFLVGLLHRLDPARPMVVVLGGLKEQERFHQELGAWMEGDFEPSFFPSWEVLPGEGKLPHADVISERLETLERLTSHKASDPAPLIVTTATALMERTFLPDALRPRLRTLRQGDRIEPLDLVEWLEEQGYEPEGQVTAKGELALRGGILDIHPLSSPWPVRLDFFGDELESIRRFDPVTQVSHETVTEVTVGPAGEMGLLAREPSESGSLFTHLPPDTLVILNDPEELNEKARAWFEKLSYSGPLVRDWKSTFEESEALRGHASLVEELDEGQVAHFQPLDAFHNEEARPSDSRVAEERRRRLFEQLHRWLRGGYELHVICNSEGERTRFREIWAELGLSGSSFAEPRTELGSLTAGFLCETAKLLVVTDAEIFGRYKILRPRRQKSHHARAAMSSASEVHFSDLEEGDYVVHLDHGIGRFVGLQRIAMAGDAKAAQGRGRGEECLVIEFAPAQRDQPPPRLYVPASEAHLVSKYVGAGRMRPAMNTLGGGRWKKTRLQTEKAVRDLAAELLAIQAARESEAGHAFAEDTPWQREFEGAFLYEETPDQQRAIEATKKDLERARPMDRLICGDVGFGKTEVAIRAAFKTVMEGRQVAFLVPTTVLATQHYHTLCERMADYPIRVEVLSRLRSAAAQARVLEEVAQGGVDIVVGTHRLVQPDVTFKDLGLVIIDEEQRFGVMHKEKFKLMRRMVDVLTLSATPIPRTLYMALNGARDLSTIETPPMDRLPVETIAAPFDERTIRDAIEREMNRGGQIYFLHNRVQTIDAMGARIRKLVPSARIVIGHGQMKAGELDRVMHRFVNGEADVLLATTIIESGLDIPNANTIIIDRADRFGLSELYQLRGRVGRYKHQAYAYLLLPRHAQLLTDARKRISALRQYATLGSGFKIAMRDLEIRGAGNLLGPQQSGHITAVGFELYCQLLKQSVSSLKGEKVQPRLEVHLRLDFLSGDADAGKEVASMGIPSSYIRDSRHRIETYRRFASITTSKELEALRNELRDRYGEPPLPVIHLCEACAIRLVAAPRSLTEVETEGDKLKLKRQGRYLMVGGRFPRLEKKQPLARLKEIRRLIQSV